MLDMQPPQFEGSFEEQVIQAEIWLRHFKEEVDNMFTNLATTVMRLKTVQITKEIERKITILADVWWSIQIGYDQDNQIYQSGSDWLVQRSTVPADVGNVESILITCGKTSGDPLTLISTLAPKQYTGNPIVLQIGDSFTVIGEQDDGEETENQLPEEEQSAET